MKKLLSVFLTVSLMLCLAACGGNTVVSLQSPSAAQQTQAAPQSEPASTARTLAVGSSVSFGTLYGKPLMWRCLLVDGARALLVTQDCVCVDVFNEPQADGAQVLWADCTLRAWLNGDFLSALSAQEQAMLLDTALTANENLGFGDYPEEEVEWKPSTDKVFLLSAQEVQSLFPDDSSRVAAVYLAPQEAQAAAARCTALFGYEASQGSEIVSELNNAPVDYWLRSNGRGYMVQTVGPNGVYSDYGANQDAVLKGVRPAVWVDTALWGSANG